MAQIAGIQDFRQEGPPGDIGTFQITSSVLIFQFTFSGVTFNVALRAGVRGWVLISSSTVFSTVLLAAATDIVEGLIVFKPYSTYTMTAAVTMGPGIMLDFQGATLDITALNVVAITMNSVDANWVHNKITGIKNVKVVGAQANTSTWLCQIGQVDAGVMLENINMSWVNNGFTIRGACYSGEIRNCTMYPSVGIFILLQGISIAAVTYASNAFKIYNNQVTADPASTGYGIQIIGDGGDYNPDGVFIYDNWFESVNYSIYTDGGGINISSNHLESKLRDVWIGQYGTGTMITNNFFNVPTTSSYGIYCVTTEATAIISDNNFPYINGKGIYSSATSYFTVTGNYCGFADASAVFAQGKWYDSVFTGNTMYGLAKGIGIEGLTASTYSNTVSGNTFAGLVKGVSDGDLNANYWTITGNTFKDCTDAFHLENLQTSVIANNTFCNNVAVFTPALGFANNIVRNNIGYVTEAWGTATGTGVQQNVAHGLALPPTVVILGEYNTGGALAYQSAAADGTNLKITATNLKTFTWYAGVYV